MAPWAAWASAWLANPWLLWGVGPLLATDLGFILTASLLELLLATGLFDRYLIHYASSKDVPRRQLLAATHARLPRWKQLAGCLKYLLGPSNVLNGFVLVFLMRWAKPEVSGWFPDSAAAFGLQFLALLVVSDFGLYWGHRIQHESKFLWKLHSKHHSIDTPTPYSTLFIDPLDAALQGSIPFAIAAMVVRPEPGVLYAFLAARIGENAYNHSGLDCWLLDLLALKLLPFRASAAFHDAHHKYSCHAKNAKNYGESFWVWDWAMGTQSPLMGRALPAVVDVKVQ